MPALAALTRWGLVVFLASFFGLIFWKLMAAGGLSGLLSGDYYDSATGSLKTQDVSAGRSQSLMFVVSIAVYYFIQILHSPSGFPPVPKAMLYVLGGSQAVFLGGKAYDLILARIVDEFKKGLSR